MISKFRVLMSKSSETDYTVFLPLACHCNESNDMNG